MTGSASPTAIVGIGETEYTRWGGITEKSQFQIAAEAIRNALNDAGLTPQDVDGFTSFSNDANDANLMQVALGVPNLRYTGMVWGGGGGGSCGAVALAVAAVQSGQADTVVAYRGLCQGQSRRFGRANTARTHNNWTFPFGLLAPAQMLAMMVRRHMYLYGTKSEHMAEIALSGRLNANRNPRAVMHGKTLSKEQYFAARMIADPLRLYDCCLESDGGCAVVVTSRERARDLRQKPVDILAAAQGSGAGWGSGPLGSHNMPNETYTTTNSVALAQDLYGRAGVGPSDIDVAQIYDHFSGMVIIALEDYGFCPRGEGGNFVADGNIRWQGGSLPINTAGGNLSEAYIHGFTHILEGVRQLRGTSTSQVKDAELCLVTGGLGVSPTTGMILGVS
ncbi:thiolase C-terminal domain-containing protein [Ferrovibrio sp.]|uniref:thiolase C-terminal domain-containing protein n=1 Tax=Ferrovibrio sp. TaxID=1917215 RepID=UPI003D12C07B